MADDEDARAPLEALAAGRGERRVEAAYALLGVLRGLELKYQFVTDTRRFVQEHGTTFWAMKPPTACARPSAVAPWPWP